MKEIESASKVFIDVFHELSRLGRHYTARRAWKKPLGFYLNKTKNQCINELIAEYGQYDPVTA